jgi:hypothetical protein
VKMPRVISSLLFLCVCVSLLSLVRSDNIRRNDKGLHTPGPMGLSAIQLATGANMLISSWELQNDDSSML